jgi:coenzyme F420-reducing hydrogenase beta subunit
MPKKQICDLNRCTGCALCSAACPKDAINMFYDNEGFYRPEINNELCIDCGLCNRICIANNTPKFQGMELDYYMCWTKDKRNRQFGSSGGMFSVIAKWVLSKGGEVVGAAFDEQLKLRHTIVNNEKNLLSLYGSKYLQSEIDRVYKEIKDKLSKGKLILFVGTPCQVDAIYSYCGKSDNLITCDLICYGVGSTKYFEACIDNLKQNYNSMVTEVKFRKKIHGCRNSSFSVKFENGKEYHKLFYLSDFGLPFSERLINRQSCYNCVYSSKERVGDLSLGDYTGSDIYEVNNKEIRSGISYISVNSEKGKIIFSNVSDLLYYENKEKELIHKTSVRQRTENLDMTHRNAFLSDFNTRGITETLNKYCHVSTKSYLMLRYDSEYLLLRKLYKKLPITSLRPKKR